MTRQVVRLRWRSECARLYHHSLCASVAAGFFAATLLGAPTPVTAAEGGQEQLLDRSLDQSNDSAAIRRSTSGTSSAAEPNDDALSSPGDDDPYTGPAGGIGVPNGPPPDQGDAYDRRVVVTRDAPRRRGRTFRPRRDGAGLSGLFAGGPYISGNISYVGAFDLNISGTDPALASGLSPTIDADLGFGFNVAGGWHFDSGIRAELEVSYFTADFDRLENSKGTFDIEGDISGISGMLNLAYDARLLERWFPHFGAGIGLSRIDSELTRIGAMPVSLSTSSDTVFSYQFILGLGFAVTPRLMISSDYRYFATSDPDFGAYESELGVHKLSAGMRWKF